MRESNVLLLINPNGDCVRKKVGRPRKEERNRPTQKLRTMLWARELKRAFIADADMGCPQGEKVTQEIEENLELSISATQFFYWWKGAQDPSITTVKQLENKGFKRDFLYAEKSISCYEGRHFSVLDAWAGINNQKAGSSSIEDIHTILFRLDAEWSPCHGRLGVLERYQFGSDDLFSDCFGLDNSDDALKEHYTRMGWSKQGLYPGPKIDDRFYRYYDPYNLSSLLVWLIAVSPIYVDFGDKEFERLALDLATATLCFLFIKNTLSGDVMYYRSSGLAQLMVPLAELFFSPEITGEQLTDILTYEKIDWPFSSPEINSETVMVKAAAALRSFYHDWLERCGYSLREIRAFL